MPNWKKVIVSGSDAILNNVTASSGILSSGDIYAPNFVGTASYATISKRVIVTNNDSTDGFLYIPFSDDNGNLYKSTTTFRFNPFEKQFNISNISAGSITASADISVSGNFYANLTEDSSNYNTVVYNTATGQFFYTGSYGGNASITIDNDANDRIITAKGNGTLNAEQNLSFNGTTLSLNGTFLHTTDLGRSFISLKEGDYYLLQAGDMENARNQTLFEIRDASSSFYFHTQNEHPHYLNSASLFISGTISGSGLYIDNYKTGTATFTGLVDALQVSASIIKTNTLKVSDITYPTTDGDDGNILMTDGEGNLTLQPNTSFFNVKNVGSNTLLKGTPVHATGTTGNTSEVIAASASNALTMPATYVLAEDIDADETGRAILTGYLNGIDTSNGFTPGDVVYVGEQGGYTPVKPSGSNLIQNIGIIIKSDASNGSILIYGSGRSNDVPNIPAGYTWVGDSDGVATPVPTSSIIAATSSAADRIFVNNANFDSYANIVTIDPSTESNGYKLLQRDDSGLAYNAAQNTLKVGHLSASALTVTESFNITGKQYSTASYHLIEVPAGQMYTQGVFFVTGSMPSDQASPDWTKFSLFKFSTSSALDLDLIINVIPDETEPVSSSILRSTSNIAAITQYPIEVSYEAWPFESGQYTFTIGAGFPLEQSFEGWIFANGVNFSGAIEQYQATNQFNPTGYPYVGDEEDTPQIAGGQSPIILSIVTGSAGIPSGYVSLRLLLSSNTSTNAFLSYIENAKLNVTCVYKLVNYA